MKTLITTTFLLLLIHANATNLHDNQKDQALVETTCKNTPNYHLCVSVLRADPGSATADVAGLGLIFVGAVKSKTKQAISLIDKLAMHRHSVALDKCKEVYEAVVKADVPEAVEALTKGDPKFAENGMADASVEADVCEGGFGGRKSPLSGVSRDVKEHAVVARAIIRNLL